MILKNKIALVTGAGRGIGKDIAIHLASLGAVIIGVDYDAESADNIYQYLSSNNFIGAGYIMDVSNFDSVNSVFGQISEKHGFPNILINNAGITRDNLLLRMSQQEWDSVINTNLSSVFYLSRCCIRNMIKERWGRIINISSVVAYIGNAGQANYAASKAGIIALSKSLASEVASRNVTVNCIAPGFIETAMTKKLTEDQRNKLISVVPMKRIGFPKDIANAVAFLASDEASYITGSTIHVNGGMYML